MNNPRPNSRKSIEQREKEFCTHFNNANAELAHNIRKNNPGPRKSKHPSFKKAWGSENKPENLPKTIEIDEKPQNEEAPRKRERKGWGVPRPNPAEIQEQQEQQEIANKSDEKRSESPLKEIQKENYSSNTSNEDIVLKRNYDSVGSQEEVSIENKQNKENNKGLRDVLSSFQSLDIRKLRQQKKEEKLKKAAQEPEMPKDSPKIQKLAEITELKQREEKSKKSVKSDSIEEEIEEEIVEDINDEPVEPEKEVSKPANRVDSSYGRQPVLKRVARPLTANVNYGYNSNFRTADPVLANVPTKDKQTESKKNIELKKDVKTIALDLKPEDNKKLVQKEKSKKEQVPEKKNLLAKRVESLDESTKKLLENILEKIETGSFDKEDLENLEASDN